MSERSSNFSVHTVPEVVKRFLEILSSSSFSCTGLGLSVVKSFVDLFGGTLNAEDRVLGDYVLGTTFVVLLPAEL